MSPRAFEFLFLSWVLGALIVYSVHEEDVLAYEFEQRVQNYRAIRHAIRTVDPAILYAPAIAPNAPPPETHDCFSAGDPLCISIDEIKALNGELDELERRLRDLYIRGLLRRGEAWSA